MVGEPDDHRERRKKRYGRRKEDQDIEAVLTGLLERLKRQEVATAAHLEDCYQARMKTSVSIDRLSTQMEDVVKINGDQMEILKDFAAVKRIGKWLIPILVILETLSKIATTMHWL